MTGPADSSGETTGCRGGDGPPLRLVAVTACPTGIAHTYMAAEKLVQAAEALGHRVSVETQGSIGVENVLAAEEIAAADGVIVAADKDVDLTRFDGKRVLVTGVAEGIRDPGRLIREVRDAPVHRAAGGAREAGRGAGAGLAGIAFPPFTGGAAGSGGAAGAVGYRALMNGVSYMIPFVVTGGLLIAVSLALGGRAGPHGLEVPAGSFWEHVHRIGEIGFALMLPVLSGYIAFALADRPALVPGMVGGWLANDGTLYGSPSGAGFLGAIVTGFLAGWLVLAIRRVPVRRLVRPVMPVIVIPVLATSVLGLFFVYALGRPVAWVFDRLTDGLAGLTGAGAAVLGVLLGLMITFDMGGPVNKTAFLFGAGLVTHSPEVMGICAAAIPVPPLGQGLATLLRRGLFRAQEREAGSAALVMGFFGITEGAIPFAAARPARVIPANMLGGAVAGAIAGLAAVTDAVPHGGPVVALLGAVGGVPMFFVAVAIGTVVTALATVSLMASGGEPAGPRGAAEAPSPVGGEVLGGRLTGRTVRPWLAARRKEEAVRELAELLAAGGAVSDGDALVAALLAREAQGGTGAGESVAFPHARTGAVTAPAVAFARSSEGVDWGAADGVPARLLFAVAVPEGADDEHLRVLAVLARRLMDPGFRARLLAAPDTPAILRVLGELR
ncbi:fructose-specific PTS transporter subunit EIIC [Streptomyces mobaraensis]|uniref:fructose-specific PTS transporter subunit EIIC n=1 Tax=Streptomyces mobaraensis TaxID=35621 RepID=UPI001877D0BD|nr:fructose-specific PTS transporter subunit EIIC [Streptomyces mobaraensis]